MTETTKSIADQEAALVAQLDALRATKPTRQQLEALDNGLLPQGVRLVNFKDREEGVTINFDESEAAMLVPVLRKICEARMRAVKA